MSVVDSIRDWTWRFLGLDVFDEAWRARVERMQSLKDYADGRQKRQIKVKEGQADDNLVENYTELIIERSISMMLGDGIGFELSDETSQAMLDEILQANSFKILSHDAAENAATFGTGYIKLQPFGAESKVTENKLLTRMIVLDPRWMKIVTAPEDIGRVIGYEMQFMIGEGSDQTVRKEVTEIAALTDDGQVAAWKITNYKRVKTNWEMLGPPVIWEYEFPPIVSWKNLPRANDCYGRSDIGGVLDIQDRVNFTSSNISKILRYHAHPKTWGRGSGLGQRLSWGADEVVLVNGQDAQLQNLEMQTDLESSREFRNDLKAALFDISRTVDLSSMKDKVGQLTNFGLRVLYNDALDKNTTKRELFGEAMLELAHRLLVLEGAASTRADRIVWDEPLPVNQQEATEEARFDLESGLVSKETLAERRGYDWESEQELIAADKTAEDNIGSALLRAFNGGQQ